MTQTTVKIRFDGKEFPFYRTNRGSYDLVNAGYKFADLSEGDLPALFASVYYQLRDCARRAGMEFNYTFDQFIDKSDDGDSNAINAWSLLKASEAPNQEPGTSTQEPATSNQEPVPGEIVEGR